MSKLTDGQTMIDIIEHFQMTLSGLSISSREISAHDKRNIRHHQYV